MMFRNNNSPNLLPIFEFKKGLIQTMVKITSTSYKKELRS